MGQTMTKKPYRKAPRRAKGPGKRVLKDGSTPEKFIQASILRWLEQTGLLHWRANSGFVHIHGRRISLGPDGISDVVVIIPPTGRFLGLEIKSAKGKLRPVQEVFRDKVTSVGGHYEVVRSLQEAQNAVAKCIGKEGPYGDISRSIVQAGGPSTNVYGNPFTPSGC